jgi:predicted DNA-binding protein (UPF0278 family)
MVFPIGIQSQKVNAHNVQNLANPSMLIKESRCKMEKAVRMTEEEIREKALYAFDRAVQEKWNEVIRARMSNFVEKSRELERVVVEMVAIVKSMKEGA